MTTTTSPLRAIAFLAFVLLTTVGASPRMDTDEKSEIKMESSSLRGHVTASEQRELSPVRRGGDARNTKLPPPPPPTPYPTPNPTPPTPVFEEVRPIRDIWRPTTPNPTNVPTNPPTTSPPPPPKVITLGDSYSSGTGIHRDGADYDVELGGNPVLNGITYDFTTDSEHACWQETDSTPGPRYASLMGQQSVFYGCLGAQTPNLNSQLDYLLAAFPLDRQHNFQGSTILFTAGGNDIRTNSGMTWPELLVECILETNFFNGCHDFTSNHIANFAAIEASLTSFYTRLATEASGARIRVLGYPKMMQRDPGCGSVTGVSRNEADWIDQQCINLNNRLIAAVNTVKAIHPSIDIEFVNVYNYLTVGACGNGPNNRHVHDKILHSYFPWSRSNSSFHPSQKGYDKYYDALTQSL